MRVAPDLIVMFDLDQLAAPSKVVVPELIMKIDKKSLTKPVSIDDLQKQKTFKKFLTNLRRGDEVWEWKAGDLLRLGAAGGFVGGSLLAIAYWLWSQERASD